jgi:hypothetical protein
MKSTNQKKEIPMSVRLTNAMREIICRELLKQRFEAEEEAFLNDRMDFADRCYDAAFTPEEREIMSKLPDGYMPARSEIVFGFGGEWHVLRFRNAKKVPYADSNSWYFDRFAFGVTSPMTREWAAHLDRKSSLQKKKDEAKTKIMAILCGVSTVKSLLKTWPEVAPWLPASAIDASTNLPAIPVAEVNAMLNLKPVKKAA